MYKLGIIGCGNIGRFVMKNLSRADLKQFSLQVIADLPANVDTLKDLAWSYHCGHTTDAMSLADRGLDVVLEAAHPSAVRKYVPPILRSGTSMVTMSVSAFADPSFLGEARRAAEEGGSRLLLPTGCIAGLDSLKAAHLAGIDEAMLTMTKGPRALAGAPCFEEHTVDLLAIKEPTVVFDGTPAEAIRSFPQNLLNVAVVLSLVTLGPDKMKLRVVCDPAATNVKGEIYARGPSGELRLEVINQPNPDSPRTSYQTCYSALATLKRFTDPVQIGT